MYDREAVKAAVTKANCALVFDRRIVAMKFLFTKNEFDQMDVPQLTSRLRYCGMIDRATRGDKLKADFSNFGCFGGARALGIVERDNFYSSGRFFQNRGLYQDLATSKEVTSHIAGCKHHAYGVAAMPVEDFTVSPDVVLIISNPNNIMRLVQGYTHFFGTHGSYKMIGNQAICAECTAHPYETNDINISVLCAGPRTLGMRQDEMAMGIVFNRFERVIDGLCMTITPVEQNAAKQAIITRLRQNNITDVPVFLDRNYGMPFFKRDLAYFSEQLDKFPYEEDLFPDIMRKDE